jgi:hypothetical protein
MTTLRGASVRYACGDHAASPGVFVHGGLVLGRHCGTTAIRWRDSDREKGAVELLSLLSLVVFSFLASSRSSLESPRPAATGWFTPATRKHPSMTSPRPVAAGSALSAAPDDGDPATFRITAGGPLPGTGPSQRSAGHAVPRRARSPVRKVGAEGYCRTRRCRLKPKSCRPEARKRADQRET